MCRRVASAASALLLLGCERRTAADSEPRPVHPAVRQLASPSAFDLVPTSSGAALVWASSSPGALHLQGFDAAGLPSSEATVELDAASVVAEVAALALGPARVVAWSEVGADGRRLRAAWLPEHGAAHPFELGDTGADPTSGRGGIALAASGQGARLLARGGPTPCTSATEPSCRAFQFFAIDVDGARAAGFPLAVPAPCAEHAAQLAPSSGGLASGAVEPFEYAVCSESQGRSALTIFSIRPSPAYAQAEEVFAGCTPLGAARFGGQSAFVAQCGGERRLARLDGDGGAAVVDSLEPRGLVCGAAGANARLGAGWLRLLEPLGSLELLLGKELAPPGSRATWTGTALLVARPTASGELALDRYACQGTALVEVDVAPDASRKDADGWQGG
jgi:hypothetical protein